MTQEEIEWFEKDWCKGKPFLKSTTVSKEYKLVREPWHAWWDYPHCDGRYFGCGKNWKSNRETQYRAPKVKKDKVRKPKDKEHWRYKKDYHTWAFRSRINDILRKEYQEKLRRMS